MLNDEIRKKRMGIFTASENNRLMCKWNEPEPILTEEESDVRAYFWVLHNSGEKKPLVKDVKEFFAKVDFTITGDMINNVWKHVIWASTPIGLISYAKEKAVESLFEHDPSLDFETQAMKNGNIREAEAVSLLSLTAKLDFRCTGGSQVHEVKGNIGATPDGIVFNENLDIITGCEIKCKSAPNHTKLLLINNNKDLLQNEFEHYVQVQTQMHVFDCKVWYFASYNPFAKESDLKFKHIIIKRDNDFIKILVKRANLAESIKQDYISELLKATNK